jgi:TRAP-type C4-dicarboxylate transport system substrate-binding protein
MDTMHQVCLDWAKKLQTDTGGRLQITVLDFDEMIQGGFLGFDQLFAHADWVWNPMGSMRMPILSSLGYFVYGTDMAGSLATSNQLIEEFPEMQAEFTDEGVKRFGALTAIGHYIQTIEGKPVRALSDLKGLRIAGGGPGGLGAILSEYGAITEGVPNAVGEETYTTFSTHKGEIDGVLTLPGLLDLDRDGVIRYATDLRIPYAPVDTFYMKLDKWNSIPPDIRKIMEDSLPWFYEEITKADMKMTESSMNESRAKGVEFIKLSEEDQNAVYNLAEKAALKKAAELDAKGLPGTKIFERARQLIKEYNDTHTLWRP